MARDNFFEPPNDFYGYDEYKTPSDEDVEEFNEIEEDEAYENVKNIFKNSGVSKSRISNPRISMLEIEDESRGFIRNPWHRSVN